MRAMGSQITSLTIGYSTVNSDTDQRKHESSELLAFVRGILLLDNSRAESRGVETSRGQSDVSPLNE